MWERKSTDLKEQSERIIGTSLMMLVTIKKIKIRMLFIFMCSAFFFGNWLKQVDTLQQS